jgi:hypothetical protein
MFHLEYFRVQNSAEQQARQPDDCLLVEAAQTASRLDPESQRDYQRLRFRRGGSVAKVAIARKLAVRLYWKLREAAQPVPSARM